MILHHGPTHVLVLLLQVFQRLFDLANSVSRSPGRHTEYAMFNLGTPPPTNPPSLPCSCVAPVRAAL